MKVESPLICTEEQIGNILRHSGFSLKGHALRGGFLELAYRDHPNEVIEESKNPRLVFHPAYPIVEGLDLKPAHAFIQYCKICKAIEEENPYRVFNELEKGIMPEFTRCPNGHVFSMRSMGRSLVAKKNGSLERKSLGFTSVKSVGINRILKGSEYAMLYEYVALSPGLEFKSTILDFEDMVEKLGLAEKSEIRIGRGRTRGFGRVSIKITLDENALDKESQRISGILHKTKGVVVLRALSPTFRLEKGSKGLLTEPFPQVAYSWMKPINLPVLNGNAVMTGLEESSGFSNIGKLPTPRFVGAEAGSLFFYRIEGTEWDTASRTLAEREFKGFGPFSSFGLNVLEVYDVG
jgi:CRISPR/Cas system CSM-associated protein Csm3 (group 7 of RAMP superfamily)